MSQTQPQNLDTSVPAAMPVKVRYIGLVQNAVGLSSEEVQLPAGARVRDLLAALQDKHGDSFRYSVLSSDGGLRPTSRVLIGDEDSRDLQGMDTPIEPGSGVAIVVLVYPAEGG
ncbi:MAG: MoaD/ThiS family protein [Chloroflexi bacterium]|nr:MoaD/ThiS family protein [Chloroflexota bacterium]